MTLKVPPEEKPWEGTVCRTCCADYAKHPGALGILTLAHLELLVCRTCRKVIEQQMEAFVTMKRQARGGEPLKFEKRG